MEELDEVSCDPRMLRMEKLEDFDAMFLYSMLRQNWLVGSVDSMVTETL